MLTGYDNPLYLNLILEEIKIIKRLFVFSIELGQETLIPKQLLQSDLSQCYRFYSPVFNMIEELMSEDKKTRYLEKHVQLLNIAHEDLMLSKKLVKKLRSN